MRQGEDVAIQVIDRGPGIPADEAANVFRRFYRGARGRATDGLGLGLGLYVTRLLVEAHGEISLVPSDAGTTFRVVLAAPRQSLPASASPEPVAPAPAPR